MARELQLDEAIRDFSYFNPNARTPRNLRTDVLGLCKHT